MIYRVGKPNRCDDKPCPIIIKCSRSNVRRRLFQQTKVKR